MIGYSERIHANSCQDEKLYIWDINTHTYFFIFTAPFPGVLN